MNRLRRAEAVSVIFRIPYDLVLYLRAVVGRQFVYKNSSWEGNGLYRVKKATRTNAVMATGLLLPEDDMFSDSYLEAFYRAHIASRRGSLDEDIAAIEAEIRK